MLEVFGRDISNKILGSLDLLSRGQLLVVSKKVRAKALDPLLWTAASTMHVHMAADGAVPGQDADAVAEMMRGELQAD